MNIQKQSKNDLLKRKEISAVLSHASNPGFAHVSKIIAEHFKVGEDVVVVKKIEGNFGSGEFLIDAFVYDSAQLKELLEPKKKEKKKKA